MNVLATKFMLLAATGLIVWVFFNATRSVLNAGSCLGSTIFVIVMSIRGLMATVELDEPGDACQSCNIAPI